MPGHYTLEVTSPGVERTLRTPAHFQREVGKVVAIRLADVGHDDRRITGTLVAADDTTATVAVDGADGPHRAGGPPRPDRSGQDRLRVGSRPSPDRQVTGQTSGQVARPPGARPPPPARLRARRARRSTRREQSRHDRSDPPARPGEGAVRGLPAARPRRRPGVGLQAPPRRRRRGRRRGRPADDGVHVHRLRPRRGRQLGQRARRHAPPRGARPHRRPDVPPGDEPAHPRGRARPQVRGVRQPRGRHRHRHHPADRHPLHAARPRPGRGPAAAGRAGAVRAAAAR